MSGVVIAELIALLTGVLVVLTCLSLMKLRKTETISIAERIQLDKERLIVEDALRQMQMREENKKENWFERKQKELIQSNTGITLPVYIVLCAVSMLAIFYVVYKITLLPILAIPCSFVGLKIPEQIIRTRVSRNIDKFNTHMVKALRRMASVMRAGGSLKQALADVSRSRSMPPIIRIEFTKVLADIEYGDTIEDALYKLYERVGSKDIQFLAIAVEIQRQLGGNLAQILDVIAQNISNRNIMQSEVKATLAQAKSSSTILSLMPFALFGIIYVLSPDYFSVLFQSMTGRMIIFICMVFIVIGAVIMRKMSKIEL